ncbi:MAG: M16 family metallopeptidase [Candidatus Izemoplasmatales bacterium]
MNKITMNHVREEMYVHTLPSGFKIYLYPKNDFSRKTAMLQINYGSIDQHYQHQEEFGSFHSGLAHFLEHMLFENTSMDIPKKFSELSASVNAFTTTNKTVYYFNTVDEFYEPLRLLLSFVFGASFDDEQIEKERKIIQSEIDMYSDELEQNLYYDAMKSLYLTHPIRTDIAGTKEDVNLISKEELMKAYLLFYLPSNAYLMLSGDFFPEEAIEVVNSFEVLVKENINEKCTVLFDKEDLTPVIPYHSQKKDMHTSLLMLSSKLDTMGMSQKEIAILEFKYILLLDNYFSKSSEYTEKLLKMRLINQSFDFSVTMDTSYAHLMFYAETKYPDKLARALLEMVEAMKDTPLDDARFQVQKKKLIGQFIHLFNSPQDSTGLIADYDQKGILLDELMETILNFSTVDLDELKIRLKKELFTKTIYHK